MVPPPSGAPPATTVRPSSSTTSRTAGSTKRFAVLPSQHGMVKGYRIDPNGSAFTVALRTQLLGLVDRELLRAATRRALAESDCTRVRFDVDDEPMTQHLGAEIEPYIVDLTAAPDPSEAVRRWCRERTDLPFDLRSDDPLMEFAVLAVGPQETWYYQRAHHSVVDGYGAQILRTRALEIYGELIGGAPAAPAQTSSIVELVEQEQHESSESEQFWVDYLAGVPERMSPTESQALIRSHAHEHSARVSAQARTALGDTLRNRVWSYPVIAAVSAYVAAACEQHEAVIGAPVVARDTPLERRVATMMMCVLPLRLAVEPGGDLAAATRRAAKEMRAVRPHNRARPEHLLSVVPVAWRTGRIHGPTVNVIPFEEELVSEGLELHTEPVRRGPAFDLLITVVPTNDAGLRVEVSANPSHYTDDETRWHTQRIAELLERLAAQPGVALDEVELRMAAEIEAAERLAVEQVAVEEVVEQSGQRSGEHGRGPSGDRPVYGEVLSVAQVLCPDLADDAPRGLAVLDLLGRPARFGMVGRVHVVSGGSLHETELLAQVLPDGLRYRGPADQRRLVAGAYVEADGVAAEVRHAAGVHAASARWDARNLRIDVTPEHGVDPVELAARVKTIAPRGSRARVTVGEPYG